jgi:hypothetical protein
MNKETDTSLLILVVKDVHETRVCCTKFQLPLEVEIMQPQSRLEKRVYEHE